MDETLTSEVSVEENTTTEEVAEDSGTNAETPAETADETTVPEQRENVDGEPASAEPDDKSEDTTSEEQAEAAGAEPDKLTVTVDGEEKELTAEEVEPLIESGTRWDAFQESYEKLQFLASFVQKDVTAFIDALMESSEKTQIELLKSQCGDNEEVAKKLYEYQKAERLKSLADSKESERQQKQEKAKGKQEQTQERLAKEYIELSGEFPGKFSSFKDVPKSVVEISVKKGISLYDAYLRFERSEAQKSEAAKSKQAEAAKQSSGSMKSDPINVAPEIDAFMQGFNRSLR